MEKYCCTNCEYYTKSKQNFVAHLKSQKHIKLCGMCNDNVLTYKHTVYTCEFCDKMVLSRQHLWKHKKSCKGNPINLKSSTILPVTEISANFSIHDNKSNQPETNQLMVMFEGFKGIMSQALNVANKNADVAIETTHVTKKTINMLNHANKNMLKATPLIKLEKKKAYELIGYDKQSQDIQFEEYEKNIKIYVSKYNNHVFDKYVGDMVVSHYKPKNVDDTNILATDVSRLSFIVLQKVDEDISDNKKEWLNDKSGKRFKSMILIPLMTAFSETITKFLELSIKKTYQNTDKHEAKLCLETDCLKLKRDIDNNKFISPILRYVAPSFSFDSFQPDNENNDTYENEKPKKVIKSKHTKI